MSKRNRPPSHAPKKGKCPRPGAAQSTPAPPSSKAKEPAPSARAQVDVHERPMVPEGSRSAEAHSLGEPPATVRSSEPGSRKTAPAAEPRGGADGSSAASSGDTAVAGDETKAAARSARDAASTGKGRPQRAASSSDDDAPESAGGLSGSGDELGSSSDRLSRSSSGRRSQPGDDIDLSVSAQFFRRDVESVPPHVDDDEPEPLARLPVSEAAMARRARFRRWVAGVIGFAGTISIVVMAKSLAASKGGTSARASTETAAQSEVAGPDREKADAKAKAAADAPKPEAAKVPDAKGAGAPAGPAKADETKADSAAAPSAQASADPKADKPPAQAEPAAAVPDPTQAAALKKETLKLLNQGKLEAAIESAKAAIAADPSDALPYLYLGSALQDGGKWKEGIQVYSDCVRTAKKGPVHECSALGGRK